jgi:hypothetical protein
LTTFFQPAAKVVRAQSLRGLTLSPARADERLKFLLG